MAEQYFRRDDFEGVFKSYFQPPELPDRFGLYQITKSFLNLPHVRNWRFYLLTLTTLHILLEIYLLRRQRNHLTHSTLPKPLRNAISPYSFNTIRSYKITATKYYTCHVLYRLLILTLLITLSVLPNLWFGIDKFVYLWSHLDRSYLGWLRSNIGVPILQPLFYLTSTLLHTILLAPSTYYRHCILGNSPPSPSSRKTTTQWLYGQWKEVLSLAWKMFFYIWVEDDYMLYSIDYGYRSMFNSIQDVMLMLTLYVLIIQPLVPPRYFKFFPMREGKTKKGIEEVAERLGMRPCGVYTYASDHAEILLSGPWWKRNVAVSEKVLEKCDTEDVIALVAREVGSWRHNPIRHLLTTQLTYASYVIPICVFCFNWRAILTSFGFTDKYSFASASQHPLQIFVLILGGALEPVFHALRIYSFAIERKIERKADEMAVKRGFGKGVAKALVKLEREDMEVVEGDWLYELAFRGGSDALSVRLERLGWSGDEEIDEKGENIGGHWEMA